MALPQTEPALLTGPDVPGPKSIPRSESRDLPALGREPTVVDLLAFAYLDDVRVLFPDTSTKFDKLREFRERIAARTRILEYLCSTRRPSAIYVGRDGRPVVDPDSNSPTPDRFWH